jgi:hypothetical protein
MWFSGVQITGVKTRCNICARGAKSKTVKKVEKKRKKEKGKKKDKRSRHRNQKEDITTHNFLS